MKFIFNYVTLVGYPTGCSDTVVLRDTMPGGFDNECDNAHLANPTERPVCADQAKSRKPFKMLAEGSPQEILGLVGQQLSPLDLAQVAQVSKTTRLVALSNMGYRDAVNAGKYTNPQITELLTHGFRDHEEAIIRGLMHVEFANTMFQELYDKVSYYGVTPRGSPSPLNNQSDIDDRVYHSVVSEIVSALAADRQFDKLGTYIAKIMRSRNRAANMDNFLRLMILEFNLDGLVAEALGAFDFNASYVIRCAQHLGFHQAYQRLINKYGQPQSDFRTNRNLCTALYGAYGMIHLSPRPPGSNGGDTRPSVSFRALRSALPKYLELPESAFEDQIVVEKLIK
ncbi:hypothetical protein BJ085DRAFT_33201 [Dimargaris cristalligena]|uniref:F-box domain-containing protein n=1 Tax=Dimargaris cristalligena TaxID=215637 RepID=A0A4P9ZMZ5_9FUNG|nr:hypothetical protein BJ085DRAFT_33201 [Dimargaris cristalligena]|eukprot:RKP34764.1 hypothetical protein BJ085DRAFT_33201 [Dimargaris cristalligena]